MLVSSRNCGSIRGLCAFVVCLFLAGEFRNLPVALLAGRKRAPDFHAFPAERFHLPCARSPVPWPSRGIALEAAPLGCFPIGIPLPSPSSTLLPMYIRQVYTFLVPLAKNFPASRSPGTSSFRTEQAGFFFRFRSCDRTFRLCRKSDGLRTETSAPSRTVCVRDGISLRHVSIAPHLTSSQTKRNNYPPASRSPLSPPAAPPRSAPQSRSSARSHARTCCSVLPPPDPARPAARNR